ncbi:MAG: DEAD/DEAH box helicase, partial [Phormidesmis sp.]
MTPRTGIEAVKVALSVLKGDRHWFKFGHGRFVLLRREGDLWVLHHTRLEISKAETKAKDYNESVRSRSRSISFNGRADGLAQLMSISRTQNSGIFWVPAATDADLPLKEAIAQSDHIGCEIDGASHAEQLQRYQWFEQVSGLSYGLQLSSGSQSIHSHIFLDEPAPVDTTIRLRRLFVACLLGDPAVTRQHQPMRFPGFFRREKGNYQGLMSASDARYSLAKVERGLQFVYADLGWVFPATLSDQLWADVQKQLKADLPSGEKRRAIAALFERGDDWYRQQAIERAKRQQTQQIRFAQQQLDGEFNLFDAVGQVEQKLSATEAFNAPAHDWEFSGSNHARGRCQWHPGKTNSAWLSQSEGKWTYHCPTCTDDRPISAFQYWHYDRRGVGQMPTGKDWAAAAKEWLALHGVSVPEPQRISALFSQPVSAQGQTQQPEMSAAEWARRQKIERDRRTYATIAAMLGVEANVDMEDEDYKKVARGIFYRPLKQQLNYETRGKLVSGFASELMPFAEGRSLLAYDCSQGTGKSNNALIPLALRTAAEGRRVLIIVPTRGLAKEFKERLNKRSNEAIAATHLDSNYYSAAIVVSCPESAYKFKGQKFDALLVDEANECLHRIESAELGNAGPQSLAAFRKLLASTKVVAIATAAMSGRTLAAVQTIGGFLPSETQLQRRSRPGTQMTITEYGNFYQWLQRIIKALRSGLRVAIPTGSQGKGRAIDRILRALFAEKNGVVIDGKATMQNQRSQFLADPDAFLEMTKPDWFIYTPVINSGVSIEGKHFDMQFEYATPHEGAQSISQRGERVRSAIGRDDQIVERHVYFSQKGAPTLEAYPDALDWQYWAGELADEANAPIGAAAALAKALGAEKALKPMQEDAEKFAAMRPNLPHFLALRAFEIIYKKELLHEDWQRYGWQITQAGKPDENEAAALEVLKVLCEKIRVGLIEQQGRTLKKTKTRESESELDEINNPFQAARAAKLQLEKLLGKDYLAKQDADFYTAWGADKSASNPGVRSVIRAQLLQIALSDPDCWQQIERMKGLKFLSGKPDPDSEQFWHLPELPAAARDIELVSIVSRCPGIADVISGKTERWTNQAQPVVAAGLYLIAHSQQLAANTKKVGLVRGYQFTDEMAPTALFNKALELMGYRVKKDRRQGSGDRLNIYRLEVEADAVAALEQSQADGENGLKLFKAELSAIRAQTRPSVNA